MYGSIQRGVCHAIIHSSEVLANCDLGTRNIWTSVQMNNQQFLRQKYSLQSLPGNGSTI